MSLSFGSLLKRKPKAKSKEEIRLDLQRKVTGWFSSEMRKKLKDNLHKQHWSVLPIPACMNRLRDEVKELEEAINSDLPKAEVVKECADIANFAMFIADNYFPDDIEHIRRKIQNAKR